MDDHWIHTFCALVVSHVMPYIILLCLSSYILRSLLYKKTKIEKTLLVSYLVGRNSLDRVSASCRVYSLSNCCNTARAQAPWLCFCTLWPCDLDVWLFDLILIGRQRVVMGYLCAEFGDCTFSRLRFSMQTNRVTLLLLSVWVIS